MQNSVNRNIKQRVKELFSWLKEQRVILSQKDASVKMGYNPCVVSALLNGGGTVSERFIESLCRLDKRINPQWLTTGEGKMIKETGESVVEESPQIEMLDTGSLVRIIEGQTKVINFVMDYLQKIESSNATLLKEISSLRKEVEAIKQKS